MSNKAIPQRKGLAMGMELKRGGYVTPRLSMRGPMKPLTKVRMRVPPAGMSEGGCAHEARESKEHERKEK